jgi:hypothetical protein
VHDAASGARTVEPAGHEEVDPRCTVRRSSVARPAAAKSDDT